MRIHGLVRSGNGVQPIDHNGRYVRQQPPSFSGIWLVWLDVVAAIDDESDRAVKCGCRDPGFVDRFNDGLAAMRAKLGLLPDLGDTELVNDLELLKQQGLDFTGFFGRRPLRAAAGLQEWTSAGPRLRGGDMPGGAVMNGVNPIYIPRNLVEEHHAVRRRSCTAASFAGGRPEPFEQRDGFERYAEPDLAAAVGYQTSAYLTRS